MTFFTLNKLGMKLQTNVNDSHVRLVNLQSWRARSLHLISSLKSEHMVTCMYASQVGYHICGLHWQVGYT